MWCLASVFMSLLRYSCSALSWATQSFGLEQPLACQPQVVVPPVKALECVCVCVFGRGQITNRWVLGKLRPTLIYHFAFSGPGSTSPGSLCSPFIELALLQLVLRADCVKLFAMVRAIDRDSRGRPGPLALGEGWGVSSLLLSFVYLQCSSTRVSYSCQTLKPVGFLIRYLSFIVMCPWVSCQI